MKQCLVGFSTSDWIVSRIIRFFTRAQCSHAFLLLRGTDLGDLVLEAGWDGWRLRTLKGDIVGSTRIVKLVYPPVSQDVLSAAVMTSLNWLGEKYNYTGLFGMAWVALGRWLGKKCRNPLRNSNSMFCSEGVVFVLREAKCPGISMLDPQSVSPDDLLKFLTMTPAKETTP